MSSDQRVFTSGQVETDEERLNTALGEWVFLVTKGPLRDAQNRTFGTFCVSRDITGRRKTEQALQDSEQRLATRPGGGWKWILSMEELQDRSAEGRPLRLLGTHTDIDAVKAAEIALPDINTTLEARVAERMQGDERMLDCALINLLDNAWKYTGATTTPAIRAHWGEVRGLRGSAFPTMAPVSTGPTRSAGSSLSSVCTARTTFPGSASGCHRGAHRAPAWRRDC